MRKILILFVLCLPIRVRAQEVVPVGTVLPVQLNSTISLKSMPGQVISARVMQNIPRLTGVRVRAGSKLVGRILEVTPPRTNSGPAVAFVFDTLVVKREKYAIVTDLRVLASPLEIDNAQIPDNGPDRGTPPEAYTTIQVGGEVVYRGGGPVKNRERVVAEPVPDGVLGALRASDLGNCRAAIDGNSQPQALWLFSTNACGVYGIPGLEIAHAGRTEPQGRIVLISKKNDLKIRGGSGMLLRVIGPASPAVSVLSESSLNQ
ncbi:MAG TPA: hypothetical protein VMU43_01700 [Candidatus Acidoferrum sp.]|nr:hypothetical protein [Candidatus Acidoferrum sp.]